MSALGRRWSPVPAAARPGGRAGERKLADDGFHVPVHGRAAQGSQIAEVIAPLASPASSSFTEALIHADGARRRLPPAV
jgi:hypothetical protein